jgi:hypothetical protein
MAGEHAKEQGKQHEVVVPGNAELLIEVPTYYGAAYPELVADGVLRDFDRPHVPLLACSADGLRVVLGSHSRDDLDAPDVQIERRRNGWAIYLHPCGGGDPSGAVYFLDDGRSFVMPERGSTPAIEFIESDTELREVDHKPNAASDDEDDRPAPAAVYANLKQMIEALETGDDTDVLDVGRVKQLLRHAYDLGAKNR